MKKYERKPTQKQLRAVEIMVANGGEELPKAKVLEKAGYSPAVQSNPVRVYESDAVKDLLAKAEQVGITDDLLIAKIKEAINNPDIKVAIDSVFKWLRLKYPELNPFMHKQGNTTNNTQINIVGVEQGAYQYLSNKTGLTIEEIKKRLEITD